MIYSNCYLPIHLDQYWRRDSSTKETGKTLLGSQFGIFTSFLMRRLGIWVLERLCAGQFWKMGELRKKLLGTTANLCNCQNFYATVRNSAVNHKI